MGSTTPVLGLPYPVGTDRVMDGDDAIHSLAQKTEDYLVRTVVAQKLTTTASFNNPTAGAVWPTVDRAALTITYNKKSAASALIIDARLSAYVATGGQTFLLLGMVVGANNREVARTRAVAPPAAVTVTGLLRLTGIAAGNVTIEPFVQSGNSVIYVDPTFEGISYAVWEGN